MIEFSKFPYDSTAAHIVCEVELDQAGRHFFLDATATGFVKLKAHTGRAEPLEPGHD